jgi:hypothetical protein
VQNLHAGMPKLPHFAETGGLGRGGGADRHHREVSHGLSGGGRTRIGGPHERVFYFPLGKAHFNPATKFSFGAGYPKTSS